VSGSDRSAALQNALGRVVRARVLRMGAPGAFLDIDPDQQRVDAPTVLLPGAEVPAGTAADSTVDVFVYLDSEDRPVATLRTPKVMLGEVAFLTVTHVTTFGSFVEWGLLKDLLVPLGEQTRPMPLGSPHPVGLYVDDTGRLAGTMKVAELLKETGAFQLDEWVMGEVWRDEPERGLFVILERAFVGLLPSSEPHRLVRGDEARFRVSSVLPDGKVELSLRAHAHEELVGDGARILEVLGSSHPPKVGDRTSPEQIRALFGISKKAFKRASGALLKRSAVALDRDGNLTLRRTPKNNVKP
jgi:predicted RNA-binding protein (virulence factor B family)